MCRQLAHVGVTRARGVHGLDGEARHLDHLAVHQRDGAAAAERDDGVAHAATLEEAQRLLARVVVHAADAAQELALALVDAQDVQRLVHLLRDAARRSRVQDGEQPVALRAQDGLHRGLQVAAQLAQKDVVLARKAVDGRTHLLVRDGGVRTGVVHGTVVALAAHHQAYARVLVRREAHVGADHAVPRERRHELAAIGVISHLAHHERVRAHPGAHHGLVSAHAAGRGQEVAAHGGLPPVRNGATLNGHVHAQATEDDDLLHAHSSTSPAIRRSYITLLAASSSASSRGSSSPLPYFLSRARAIR